MRYKILIKKGRDPTTGRTVWRCATFTTLDAYVIDASPKFEWLVGKSFESAISCIGRVGQVRWEVKE